MTCGLADLGRLIRADVVRECRNTIVTPYLPFEDFGASYRWRGLDFDPCAGCRLPWMRENSRIEFVRGRAASAAEVTGQQASMIQGTGLLRMLRLVRWGLATWSFSEPGGTKVCDERRF